MKGLFKSKPKTPVDIVRQTRDLLIFADRSASEVRISKREEKVLFFAPFRVFMLIVSLIAVIELFFVVKIVFLVERCDFDEFFDEIECLRVGFLLN